MIEFLKVSFLAALQGVAEFLPISSSGHLVIAQHALGMKDGGLRLDVFLHLGTLAAIFAYYRIVISRLVRGLLWRSATWEHRRGEFGDGHSRTQTQKRSETAIQQHEVNYDDTEIWG